MILRIAAVSLALTTASAGTGQVSPQQSLPKKPSVEGYLCTFAGKCDGVDAPLPQRDAPATKGFRLARPTGTATAAVAPADNPAARRTTARSAVANSRVSRRSGRDYGASVPRAVGYAAAPRTSAYATNIPANIPGARRRADLMVGFELNSDQLSSVGRDAAMVFAQSLLTAELRGKRFLIEGHTDERGGRIINGPLSARRAQRVADFLIAQGVEPTRLQTRGLGSSAPLPGHRSTDPSNRRVEAELVS